MAASGRPPIFVHLLPTLIPPGALKEGVAVVVDVLRATSVMVRALASGCAAIVPCLEIEDAIRARSELPQGTAILAGERRGLPIEGFDFGNSPGAFTPEVCRGKTLVMTTTNGTRAILASLEAERVFIASFANLTATVGALISPLATIHVVCSGTEGQISYEDTLLAGAIVRQLRGESSFAPGNDETEIAAGLFERVAQEMDSGRSLAECLSRGRGGRRVKEIGLAADIEEAARGGVDVVAELRRDPLRIVDMKSLG